MRIKMSMGRKSMRVRRRMMMFSQRCNIIEGGQHYILEILPPSSIFVGCQV
jgi:hypothetical protein